MLTQQQQAFVTYFVASGCTATEAARIAGYAYPAQEAYRLIRLPHIVEALQIERARLIDGDLACLALTRLRAILCDSQTDDAVALRAISLTLGLAGHRPNESVTITPRNKALSEMSVAELEAMVDRLRESSALIQSQETDRKVPMLTEPKGAH